MCYMWFEYIICTVLELVFFLLSFTALAETTQKHDLVFSSLVQCLLDFFVTVFVTTLNAHRSGIKKYNYQPIWYQQAKVILIY